MAVPFPFSSSAIFIFLITFLCTLTTTAVASSPTPDIHHLSVTRRPLRSSRLFALARRPWYNQFLHLIPSDVSSRLPYSRPVTSIPTKSHLLDYSSPIHGSITPLGEYYVSLSFCGQLINVQIDTGSSTMAVPLKECSNCLAGDRRLDLSSRFCSSNSGIIGCESSLCSADSCSSGCGSCSISHRACCSRENSKGCSFQLLYADQSGVTGTLVRANVGISTITTDLSFGGILRQSSFEASQVDGIFGLAYKTLACNPSCVLPLLDTLVESGKVARDIFSLCTGRKGGVLSLGGSNSGLYQGDLNYVPFSKSSQNLFYKIDITGASIGGVKVDLPVFSNGIVDSGTTLFVVSGKTYTAIRKFFQSKYCNVPGLCLSPGAGDSRQISSKSTRNNGKVRKPDIVPHPYFPHSTMSNSTTTTRLISRAPHTWFEPGYCVDLSSEEVGLLPTITIHLNGYDLQVEPQVYMIPHYIDRGVVRRLYHCLGIASLEGMEYMPNDVIIGDTVLQKYFVEYDRENERLGFAIAKDCHDPLAREPQQATPPPNVTSKHSGFFGLIYRVPTIIWYIIVLGLVLIGGSRFLSRRNGYDRIQS